MNIGLKKSKNFTIVSNQVINDIKLSLQAKGLMLIILSNTDEWIFYLKELSERSKNGIDSTRAALKELEENGYLFRYRLRDKNGRYYKTVWYFDDEGNIDENDILTTLGNSIGGKSIGGKSNTNNNNNNNTNNNNTNTQSDKSYLSTLPKDSPMRFEEFVRVLKDNLLPTDEIYPTIVHKGKRYGVNLKRLLYCKDTNKLCDRNLTHSIFKSLYVDYLDTI